MQEKYPYTEIKIIFKSPGSLKVHFGPLLGHGEVMCVSVCLFWSFLNASGVPRMLNPLHTLYKCITARKADWEAVLSARVIPDSGLVLHQVSKQTTRSETGTKGTREGGGQSTDMLADTTPLVHDKITYKAVTIFCTLDYFKQHRIGFCLSHVSFLLWSNFGNSNFPSTSHL